MCSVNLVFNLKQKKILFILVKIKDLLCMYLNSLLHLKDDGSDPSLDEKPHHLLLSSKLEKRKLLF